MGETVEEMKKNYEENLKPHDYLKLLNSTMQKTGAIYEMSLTAIYKLMKSGRFKGSKLLEIGSGATVHNIASASAYFTEIVQSDFVEANCEELRKWLRCESQLDWTPFLKAIAKIEGMEDTNSSVREIEDRIRKSVKAVARCDVLSDEVIPREVATQYDVIITSLTLEAAAPNLEEYVAILKRLNRLLRKGGGLVLIGVLNERYWKTAGGRFTGSKLLEIGSGPTVHNIASASAYFTEIVQSDFVEANCEELRKWLKCESQLDWTPLLKAVAKIEGMEDTDAGVREIEGRIRKSVKVVVRCDVLSNEVIPREVATQYDVIITSLTLDGAAPNLEEYVAILKRLNRLLRPGGGLVLIGVLNGMYWKTAGGEFHSLSLTQEDIDKALDKSGFSQKDWVLFPKKMRTPDYAGDGFFYVASTKI